MHDERDILSVTDLDVSYGSVSAVRGVSLAVGAGEIVGIVGESGSGKSTLLRAVAHLLPPAARIDAGSIAFAGRDITRASAREMRSLRGSALSYLFQNAERSFDPLFTIGAQFDEVMRAHEGAANVRAGKALRGGSLRDGAGSASRDGRRMRDQQREKMRGRQQAALERMGFADPDRVLTSLPSELSGGMCQRVALAFALAASPQLLLADEPTSSLDGQAQARVIKLLRELNEQEGLAILMVSHDIELVASFASRIIVMHEGRIVETGESARIMNDPQDPYTRSLIAAIPHVMGTVNVEPLGARHARSSSSEPPHATDATEAAAAARATDSTSKGGGHAS